MTARILVLATLALMLSPHRTAGWGDAGHRIVCEIAWQEATPQGKALVTEILRGDADDPTLASACTWPDRVRGDHSFDWAKPHHFVNIPPGSHLDPKTQCPPKGCAPRSIGQRARILADTNAPMSERRDSLKFLGHFVGDIHQPLHVGYPRDLGGNNIEVRICTDACADRKLHSVWDTSIIVSDGRSWPTVSTEIQGAITDEQRTQWKTADVAGWVAESFQLAENDAYSGLQACAKGDKGFVCNGGRIDLDGDYVAQMRPIAFEQLQRGGVRLAFVIDEVAAGRVPAELEAAAPVIQVTPSDRIRRHLVVRRAPGSDNPRIGVVRPGETAELLGVLDQWYRVRLDDAREGYVHPDLVVLSG